MAAERSRPPKPSPLARAFVEWTLRHGRLLWVFALILAVPATWRTATLYMRLKSDFEELLPRKAPSVLAVDELRKRMGGLQYLGVIVDTGSPENLPAGETFLDDLAARVRTYPPELARSVRTGFVNERAFLEDHAPLYVDFADLSHIRARIEARRDWEVAHETGTSLDDDDDDEKPPSLDFSDVEEKYKDKLHGNSRFPDGRWSSKEQHLTMLLIEVGRFSSGTGGRPLLERVQGDVAALGGPGHYAPGMSLGYTSDVAIAVEELSALVQDLSVSSVIVMLAVGAVIVLYYRWWRSLPILVVPLLLATVYAFALASLPPFNITELNSNTAFLGSIIVGNGINFGIVLLARYVEERRRGTSTREALVMGVWSARVGTLAAALAAGVAYGALIITEFRGFRQFGFIGGIGMLLSWLVAFVLMPPLIAWLDRTSATAPPPKGERSRIMVQVANATERLAIPVVVIGALLTVGAGFAVRGFGVDQLESDMSRLRRADTWKDGEGYWGRKGDELLGEYLTPTVLLCDSEAQARAVAAAARDAASQPPLQERIETVRSADDVLPRDQVAKIDEAAAIREDLTPKMRSLIAPEKRKAIDRLLGKVDLSPIDAKDLPATFTTALREKDGTFGKSVLVYPRKSHALWEGPPLIGFVSQLRAIAAAGTHTDGPPDRSRSVSNRPARVAGALPVSADLLSSLERDAPRSTLAAFLGVVAVVALLFRWHKTTLYVAGSLMIGALWLLAGAVLLGVKINFANAIAFPITFGIGVDYSVNVVSRYLQDGERDPAAAIRSTGGAVALCSLTTIIGYSSLLMAQNRGLYLFGLLAVMGEVACLTTAVVLLPAVLIVLQRKKSASLSMGSETRVGSR
jgi:predicted RND superfamily exporter protein